MLPGFRRFDDGGGVRGGLRRSACADGSSIGTIPLIRFYADLALNKWREGNGNIIIDFL